MVDTHNNPVVPINMLGAKYGPYENNALGIQPSKVIVVDSRDRDRSVYPSASSFRVKLQRRYKRVYSVALRMAFVPALEDTTEHYCVLRSRKLALMEGAVATGEQPSRNGVFNDAFALIPFRRDLPYEGTPNWQPGVTVFSDSPFQKQFSPPQDLSELDLSLWIRGNGDEPMLHPLAEEPEGTTPQAKNNVVYVFEVIAAV